MIDASHLILNILKLTRRKTRAVLERLRIAFTANGKREIRVYVFSKKRVHG